MNDDNSVWIIQYDIQYPKSNVGGHVMLVLFYITRSIMFISFLHTIIEVIEESLISVT